jgi:hypothetical protein
MVSMRCGCVLAGADLAECAAVVCCACLLQLRPNDDPNNHKTDFVLEAGGSMMRLLQGAYSCITLVKGVSLHTRFRSAKHPSPRVPRSYGGCYGFCDAVVSLCPYVLTPPCACAVWITSIGMHASL